MNKFNSISKKMFIFAAVIAMTFVGCSKSELGVTPKTEEELTVLKLKTLLANIEANNVDYITKYLEEKQSTLDLKGNDELGKPKNGVSVKTVDGLAPNQIIVKEYFDKYIIQTNNEINGVIEYTFIGGNVDFDEIINDSKLTLEDREFLTLTLYSVVKFYEALPPVLPIEPAGNYVKYCDAAYTADVKQIEINFWGGVVRAWTSYLRGDVGEAIVEVVELLTTGYQSQIYAAEARRKSCYGTGRY